MDPGAKRLFKGPNGPKGPLGLERSDFFKGPKGLKCPLGPERSDSKIRSDHFGGFRAWIPERSD